MSVSVSNFDGGGSIEWPAELQRHKPWLLKVLRCRVGDRHEVEDLYQDVAVQVLRQANSDGESNNGSSMPANPEKVAPWLYRITVRQAVNFHRRMNRKTQAHPTDQLEPTTDQPEPLQWLLQEENTNSIRQAMADLRPQDREILTLKYSENWTYQKLSDHLGVPVGSIEHRLAQARKRLRKILLPLTLAN